MTTEPKEKHTVRKQLYYFEQFTFNRPGLSDPNAATTKAIEATTQLPLNPDCDVLPSGLMDCLFSCMLLALRFGSERYCFKQKSYRTERYFLIASFLIVSCLNAISL